MSVRRKPTPKKNGLPLLISIKSRPVSTRHCPIWGAQCGECSIRTKHHEGSTGAPFSTVQRLVWQVLVDECFFSCYQKSGPTMRQQQNRWQKMTNSCHQACVKIRWDVSCEADDELIAREKSRTQATYQRRVATLFRQAGKTREGGRKAQVWHEIHSQTWNLKMFKV